MLCSALSLAADWQQVLEVLMDQSDSLQDFQDVGQGRPECALVFQKEVSSSSSRLGPFLWTNTITLKTDPDCNLCWDVLVTGFRKISFDSVTVSPCSSRRCRDL
ncbi:hypothetical protein GOODEAATRI_001419 [Goodea atripinnis]|uniref:Uncharacterized protein n=1 Tax=Goodea atripinnis TaxID=208336 RepID=A0ABV0PUE7_9TELE